jgi:D-3-phosphoglycerate dehydrogenase
MYRFWFERTLPAAYAPLLEGVAIAVGAATETPDAPYAALGTAQAIIAGGRLTYDARLMDLAPELRVISRSGIGLNNVSIPEATVRGIAVCNAPDAPTISTAEHAIALMFAVARQLKWCDRALQRGGKTDFFNDYDGLELRGTRLGLIGLGRIGSRVAKLALALEMTVIGFDPFISAEHAQEIGVELVSTVEEVLPMADIVSLHVPLTPETQGMINAERLARMKPGAILINAARGGLVDEAALLGALENGHLRGAGLDVFVSEPPSAEHPLLSRDDVVATPHIASATNAGKDRMWQAAIIQALQVLKGERPAHLVNPEIWPINTTLPPGGQQS